MAGVPLGFARFRPWYAALRTGAAFNPLDLPGLLIAFDYSDLSTLFQESTSITPVDADGQPVGRINSVSGALYADQATSTARVTYRTNPPRVTFDASNDAYTIRLGAAKTGTFFTATTEGVAVGTFTAGADYQIPINPLYSAAENNQTYKLLYDRILTAGEVEQVVAWLKVNKNAGSDVYTGSFNNQFRGRTDITSLDLSRWDTSGITSFNIAWAGCLSLASFPPNVFDGCLSTLFTSAFSNTNLTQESIDNILVSINSNGTSGGSFGQSGGSAPSATGEAAIDAMRLRGWTVIVTGGY